MDFELFYDNLASYVYKDECNFKMSVNLKKGGMSERCIYYRFQKLSK